MGSDPISVVIPASCKDAPQARRPGAMHASAGQRGFGAALAIRLVACTFAARTGSDPLLPDLHLDTARHGV
jgi:hypothetical protein